MKTFLMSAAFVLFNLMVFGQDQDPKAKAILDELSKKTKSYSSIEVEFTMKTVNKTENVNESFNGKAKMKGNKYTVDLGKQKILCDGVKIWTLLIKEKECHESLVEDAEDDALNPTKMLTIWEKGFKFRLVKDEGGIQEINLVPINPGKAKYHTVIVKIDKAKQQVKTVIVKGKNGDVTTLEVTKFNPNISVEDTEFKFSKKDYPGFTIID